MKRSFAITIILAALIGLFVMPVANVDARVKIQSSELISLYASTPTIPLSKDYDGNVSVSSCVPGILSGAAEGDSVSLRCFARYSTPSIATGKTITVMYSFLNSSDSEKYTLPANYYFLNGEITTPKTPPIMTLRAPVVYTNLVAVDGSAVATTPNATIVSIKVYWGDGESTNVVSPFLSTTYHTYLNAGNYTIKAVPTDSNGLVGSGDSKVVNIAKTLTKTGLNDISPATVTYPNLVKISGKLTTQKGVVIASKNVLIKAKNSAGSWVTLKSVATSSTGIFSYSIKPIRNTEYQAVFDDTSAYVSSFSATKSVKFRPYVGIAAKYSKVKINTANTISFSTVPAKPSTYLYVQTKSGAVWTTIAKVKTDSAGKATYSYKQSKAGTKYLRAVILKASTYETGVSKTVSVVVY